ncbi:MAG: hypothetical protein HFF50_02325 [Lawsonibacter sp.]|nr:hypothetical protein [Lawsonibacter sp.]
MMIAAAVNEARMDALIPEVMDEAAGVLLFDAEDPSIAPRFATQNTAQALTEAECEALLCGFIYDSQFFETVAQAGITRYFAANMTVEEAVKAMDSYQLKMIPDYVGGPGCSDHGHGHEYKDCDGDCGHCTSDCTG